MSIFRNSEVKIALAVYAVVSAAALAASFTLGHKFAVFTLFLCAVFISLYLIFTYLRYRQIARLSGEIDRILHGDECFSLKDCREGELSVLQSEIYKMTVRLRERGDALRADKLYLADSLADISHQIRTPLTSVNILVSLISREDIPAERRQRLSHELYDLLSRIDWLITALLKISKLDAGAVKFEHTKLPLKALLERAIAPISVPAELRGVALKTEAAGSLLCDVDWTCEAVTNIVKNCMEYTPEGGKIEITASENPLYSEITVSDTGSGIDPEDLPHIFERFYKGKSSGEKSFGIGLALARVIITSQNGTVKAENKPCGGAKFTLRFYKSTV